MRLGMFPLLIVPACATTSAAPGEPAFPPVPAMPPVALPTFYGKGTVERVPGSTGEALVSFQQATPSLGTQPRRASRLLAQAARATDVLIAGATGPHNEQAEEVEPSKERSAGKSDMPAGPGASDRQAVPDKTAMIDIEATLQLMVEDVRVSAAALRDLARKHQAMITEDVVEEGKGTRARFTVRVPSVDVDAFLAGCEALGQARSRQVQARDIGKEFHDAQLLLGNLTVAMHRYQEILKGAPQVSDVLAVERELDRLRADRPGPRHLGVDAGSRVAAAWKHDHQCRDAYPCGDGALQGSAETSPG